ncbi:dorsal-ventral patterning tolloid-like protein 1 [Mytilus galloprovincialis]|uniref:dorsal-ventral patterning tolloid-like protein 1 n=1 Tax=Mytilus galloprovincialis TaxID=29158 RepID=UPI003F7C596F
MWKNLDLLKYSKNVVLLATVWLQCFVLLVRACGQYIELGSSSTSSISISNSYAPYSNCIWVVEADSGYRVELNISSFVGQELSGSCVDYITVRDGSDSADEVLGKTCTTLTNSIVTSTARWMWVQFKSDGEITTSGLTAKLSTVYAGSVISNYSSPLESCKSFQYECDNRICLTRAYLCDGFEDCGCSDCDESACTGLPFSRSELMGMSIGIGSFLSIGIFVFSCLYERYRKLKAIRQGNLEMDPLAGNSKKAKIAWHK